MPRPGRSRSRACSRSISCCVAGILAVLAIVASFRLRARRARGPRLGSRRRHRRRAGARGWRPVVLARRRRHPDDAITVLSWNLEMDSKPPAAAVAGIADLEADVVALQELTPEFAAAIADDATLRARYPYRLLDPRPGPDGLGVLSAPPAARS